MLFCIPRHHNKKKLPSQQLLSHIPHPVPTGLYQRFFKYIDRFSTFIGDFSLYRRFDIGYRLTDNFRQSIYTLYPTTTKRSYPHSNFFPIYPPSTNRIISTIFQIYRSFLHFYRRFFIISTIRHRISTYRQFSAIYLCSIPRHYNKRSYPHGNFFPYTPPSTNRIISMIFQIYRSFLHLYQRFFIISAIRHKISI